MLPVKQISLVGSFFESDRRLIVVAIIASVVSGVSSALLVGFIARQFVATKPFGMGSVLLFLVLLVFSVVTTLFASKVLIEASSTHSYSLRMTLCRRILSTSFEKVEKIGRHRLIAMLTEDLNDIAIAYTNIPILVTNFTRVLFCILYLFWIAPGVVAVTVVFCIPVVYVQIQLYKRARQQLRELLPVRDKRYGLYVTLTNGMKELLLDRSGRIRFVSGQLDKNAQQFRDIIQKSFMANQYAANWGQSAYFVIIFVLLLAASKGFVAQEIVAAVALVGLFIRSSMNSLLQAIPRWMKASVAVDKMNGLSLNDEQMELYQESRAHGGDAIFPATELTLADVNYTYKSESSLETSTIGPLDITFKSSEIVFITGGNGSGKTTFLKLITSMYQPESGSISLNQRVLTSESLEWYRSHIHAIFSDFCLYGALNDYFNEHSTDSDKQATLSDFRLPDSLLSESSQLDSIELSSGQRARLALLPVFFSEKPIIMFDEWAAHQDPEYKAIFYYQLLPELRKRNKLVIVITHDDRYFDAADRIVEFESGKIVG